MEKTLHAIGEIAVSAVLVIVCVLTYILYIYVFTCVCVVGVRKWKCEQNCERVSWFSMRSIMTISLDANTISHTCSCLSYAATSSSSPSPHSPFLHVCIENCIFISFGLCYASNADKRQITALEEQYTQKIHLTAIVFDGIAILAFGWSCHRLNR